ncbi:MAG: hypothetical protein K0U29_03395 [Gammaproteobacteria bacterium]|nr:hypothetical protein [Gammaproteobacteria bacterium]MCH9743957.1 hypothetical protein [Gammaproteobacteria bacterium]
MIPSTSELAGFIAEICHPAVTLPERICAKYLADKGGHPVLAQLIKTFHNTYAPELSHTQWAPDPDEAGEAAGAASEDSTATRRRHSIHRAQAGVKEVIALPTHEHDDDSRAHSKFFAFLIFCALYKTLPVTTHIIVYGTDETEIEGLEFRKLESGARLQAIEFYNPKQQFHLLMDIGGHPDNPISIGTQKKAAPFEASFTSTLDLSNPEGFLSKINQILLPLTKGSLYSHKKIGHLILPLHAQGTLDKTADMRNKIFQCIKELISALKEPAPKSAKTNGHPETSDHLNGAVANVSALFKEQHPKIAGGAGEVSAKTHTCA